MTAPPDIGWAKRLAANGPEGGATLMEVCGTHTVTARRAGIHSLLPEGVRLLSGPGCPVCVTPIGYIDHAVALAQHPEVVIATFGDLIRVPGSTSSLERARAQGGSVNVVYSAVDALEMAAEMPSKKVVFLGVGFETTAPTVAAALLEAVERGLTSFTVLSAHRLIPPALEALLGSDGDGLRIDGFLAPGHVSTIIGVEPYRFVAERQSRPVVVTGFEAEDMLLGIDALLRQLGEGRAEVENAYKRAVRDEGNPTARELMLRAFAPTDCTWRGLGTIPGSGLALRPELAEHDAALRFEVEIEEPIEPSGCLCGTILRGEAGPEDCALFGGTCSPEHPVGACMVSSEGACSAAYRFGRLSQ